MSAERVGADASGLGAQGEAERSREDMSSRRQKIILIVATTVALLFLCGILVWQRRGSSERWDTFLVGDPRMGAQTFQQKGCSGCHSVLGAGAKLAPDLGRSSAKSGFWPAVRANRLRTHPGGHRRTDSSDQITRGWFSRRRRNVRFRNEPATSFLADRTRADRRRRQGPPPCARTSRRRLLDASSAAKEKDIAKIFKPILTLRSLNSASA